MILKKYILKENNEKLNLKKGDVIFIERFFKGTKEGGEYNEIFENPSISELESIDSWTNGLYGLPASHESVGGVRALVTLDGKTLYVWDGNNYKMLHRNVIEKYMPLGLSDYYTLEIFTDGTVAHTTTSQIDAQTKTQRNYLKNPYLQKIISYAKSKYKKIDNFLK